MNELMTFRSDDFGIIRTKIVDDEPWFVGKDVTNILGYTNSRKALYDHVDEEDKEVTKCDTPGGMQHLILINESGLYSLVMLSKLPAAKTFKRWITKEVLPSIRKTGRYELTTDGSEYGSTVFPTTLPDSKDYLTAARLIAHCPKERLRIVLGLLENGGFDMSMAKAEFAGISTSDVGQRIEDVIQRKGISLTRLATLIGVPDETLRSYYKGLRFPRPDKYVELVNALDTLQV